MASGGIRGSVVGQQDEYGGRADESFAGSVLTGCSVNYGRQRTLTRLKTTRDGRELEAMSTPSRLATLLVQLYNRFIQELNSIALPLKVALASSICSILCFLPGRMSVFNSYGTWAVITVDLVMEANVGVTLSQGINQTLGTVAAAALGLLVNFFVQLSGKYEPYFLVFWVFVGGALATMFKFSGVFRDRWNLAVAISLMIFHVLILTKVDFKDKLASPFILLFCIVIGFLTASLTTVGVAPRYAGSAVNELVAKNFERAGNVMERCVIAYSQGMVLEEFHDIHSGEADDHNIHMSLHEITETESQVEKLLKAVPFEPCHGKFFFGYPWDVYGDVTENLRQTLYDVLELESCLHSEIQAPLHLRHVFEDEFHCIGKECAQVFRNLGESIRAMRRVHSLHPLQQAEEGALLLQHKIAKYTSSVIGDTGSAESEIAGLYPIAHESQDVQEAQDVSAYGSPQPPVERFDSNTSSESVKSRRRSRLADGHEEFFKRQETMSHQWDVTVQRIAALSLIKFAALLIELVTKARFVVASVKQLEMKAHFEDDGEEDSFTAYIPKVGNRQV